MMIELKQKNQIDALYRKYGHKDSAHSFLSLFVYQDGLKNFHIDENGYYAELTGSFMFPCGSDEFKTDFIKTHLNSRILYITVADLPFFDGLSVCESPELSEYVYSRTEQNTLPGHKFSRVRAKLSKFEREVNASTVLLTEENLKTAYRILEKWQPKEGEGDIPGALRTLDNFSLLDLSGAVTCIDSEPVAYVCGGEITPDTYLLVSAKQNSDIQGLNIRIKYDFYRTLTENIGFINTESDHGCTGVRIHKNDLRPVSMNIMYKYEGIK